MTIAEKIPGMTDAELAMLHENARRLSQRGDAKQKTAAEGLLPAIDAELAERLARKPAPAPRKRAAPKKKKI